MPEGWLGVKVWRCHGDPDKWEAYVTQTVLAFEHQLTPGMSDNKKYIPASCADWVAADKETHHGHLVLIEYH